MSTERKQRPVKPIPDALPPAETVAVEKPWLPKLAILSIIAGILPVIAFILQSVASRGIDTDIEKTTSVAQALTVFAAGDGGAGIRGGQAEIAGHYGEQWILVGLGGVLSGLGLLLAAPVLYGLIRAAWRRRPSFPRWFLWAPIVGGVLFGLGSIIAIVYQAAQYHDFSQLPLAQQTNGGANEALTNARDDLGVVRLLAGIGSLASAVGLGAAALSAMNVGLVTRVIGAIGVMLAILVVIPLLGQQGDFLRAFWFIALGFTLLGRWPGGRPPAWDSGEPRPWPSRAQMMEEADRANAGGAPEPVAAPAPTPKASSGTARRKRRK
jgi:hypothetical protein